VTTRARALVLAALLLLAPQAAQALEFKPYGRGAFAQLRKEHADRPLIAHFWSVTCPPCLAELPEWAKLLRERKGVDVVFVNVDPDGDRARAAMRIEKAGLAGAAHYAFADDFAERLYYEVDTSWRGEMPFTALVAPDGGIVAVTGAIDDPLIAGWLEKRGKSAP
jgi:thiol-disulfide isomerase/thioredoxin